MKSEHELNQVNYNNFCKQINISPLKKEFSLLSFSCISELANKTSSEKLTAATKVLLDCFLYEDKTMGRVDRVLIDYFIAKIDKLLSRQLDEILHHSLFQELESIWRGVEYLVKRTDFRANIKIELLNVDKEQLAEDFNDVTDITQTGLYKQVYEEEYDTPGGEPISAIISDYAFSSQKKDIDLLTQIAKISSATHCPFIGSINADFFKKQDFEEVSQIHDLMGYVDCSEYAHWNSFRELDESKYIGLTCPRFLLRLPYGSDNPVRAFNYDESVYEDSGRYLWGCASFAFAANMSKSFRDHGWTVNIRGPGSGGKVEQLPLPYYDIGHGVFAKIPTEIIIPETRELELANLGFIPLSYYKNSDYACFFSANSSQKPSIYLSDDATANSRINSRLPYVFLSARIAHYLKVLQRETIGSNVTKVELEERLNIWLKTLVTKMNHPDPEQISLHPLRDGYVNVAEIEDNPGFYKVTLYIVPHFQVEGVDVKLSIVGKMPNSRVNN